MRPVRFLQSLLALSPAALFAAETPPPADLAHPPEVVTAAQLAALPPHPRLLADAARWKQLAGQIRTDPASAEIFAILHQRADALLNAPPIDYHADPANILPAVREAERRILTFAMVYRLTGDDRYLAGARRIMKTLVDEPWKGTHFLDTAEATFTLSVCYDWLYDQLTPAERDTIADKVHTQALVVSVTNEDKNGWIWADHNWNQVCNGGLVTGAIVFAERDPALALHVINRAIANLPRAAAAYAPDGVYPEGPTYWNFGTTYHLIQLETYRTALGTSEGLEKFPGFLNSAAFLDQVTGPTGDSFNYADNLDHRGYSGAVLWFARENHRPDLALAELARIRKLAPTPSEEDHRDLPLSLLWWKPLPDPIPAVAPAPLHWRGESIQPLAVLRSAWNDPLATWLAIKGGTPGHSHAHMDVGSFVLEALGVRWAIDPVRDDYSFIRRGGYTQGDIFTYDQNGKRWAVFRLGPEGHNILRFGAAEQDVNSHATVSPIVESADGASVEINLDSTYAGQAASVHRRATLLPDASVILADTWKTLDKPATITAQWLTRATVTPTPDGLLLEQDGRTLRLSIAEIAAAKIEIQSVTPMLNPKIDSPAPDLRRIVIRLNSPANTSGTLTIHAIPGPRILDSTPR